MRYISIDLIDGQSIFQEGNPQNKALPLKDHLFTRVISNVIDMWIAAFMEAPIEIQDRDEFFAVIQLKELIYNDIMFHSPTILEQIRRTAVESLNKFVDAIVRNLPEKERWIFDTDTLVDDFSAMMCLKRLGIFFPCDFEQQELIEAQDELYLVIEESIPKHIMRSCVDALCAIFFEEDDSTENDEQTELSNMKTKDKTLN